MVTPRSMSPTEYTSPPLGGSCEMVVGVVPHLLVPVLLGRD
uniref:Uncharacterized protein n=1 Tax=Anguilla anguilla TaxID=7936 RepID=A0A0E9TMW1_ANGAN